MLGGGKMEECHKKRPKEVMMKRKSSHILENHIYSCVSNDLEIRNCSNQRKNYRSWI